MHKPTCTQIAAVREQADDHKEKRDNFLEACGSMAKKMLESPIFMKEMAQKVKAHPETLLAVRTQIEMAEYDDEELVEFGQIIFQQGMSAGPDIGTHAIAMLMQMPEDYRKYCNMLKEELGW